MSDLQERLQAALGAAYRIEKELGGGGMSRVFVAEEVELGRRVVIKVLPPEIAAGVNVDRFRREIRLAASLQHPLIVPLLTAESSGDLLYYVMPFIAGDSLRVRLLGAGALPIPDTVRILRDVADALAYAHRHGVVHRDIKPGNVLLAEQHALVSDFGVAKAISQSAGSGALTTVGVALGTPGYMAPEQAAADPNTDHRCDIYAVGVLAYEMLTGRPPFAGTSPQQVLAAQLTEAPPPVIHRREGVPPLLAAAVMRCLQKEPADRWSSVDELRVELEAIPTPSGGAVGLSPAGRPKRRVAWVAAAGLVLLAVGGGWLTWRREHSTPVSPGRVAVLPFAVHGGEDIAYLGEGMVNLLGTSLDGAGDLHSVDPRALLSAVAREPGRAVDPRSGGAIAQRLGAGLYVLGDIVKSGERLRVEASLYEPRRGPDAVAQASVEGATGALFTLVDELAAQLLAHRSGGPGTRVTRIAAVTTSSLPALKAYLEGEALFRAGRFGPAVESLQRAVGYDSLFALAYYRLSIAAEWLVRTDLANRAAEQAVRHSDRLSEHDRLLLEALLAARHGDPVQAERLFRSIVGTYPDDIEAWWELGEVLFHYGALQGRSISDSREAFERMVAYEPGAQAALVHLARIAAIEGRMARLDSLVQRILVLAPESDRALEMRVLRAMFADSTARAAVQAQVRAASDAVLPQAGFSAVIFNRDGVRAEEFVRLMVEPGRSLETRAVGHEWLAGIEVGRGRWRAAQRELAALDNVDHAAALEFRGLFSALPFVPAPLAQLRELLSALSRWNAAAVPAAVSPIGFFAIHNGVHDRLRAYLLGLVSVRADDTAAAQRWARELERMGGAREDRVLARNLALGIRAQLAQRGRRPAEALALLDSARMETGYEPGIISPFFGLVLERFARPQALAALGRTEDAIRAYGSFDHFSSHDWPLRGPSHLERARLYEKLGQRARAIEHYAAFVELWRDCDPELRPLVQEARSRLATLAATGT